MESEVNGFDPSEIEATLESLQVLLADPDRNRRLDLYTEDAVAVESGEAPVRGMRALLARQDVPVLLDVEVRPELIEGDGRLASAFGHASCSFEDSSGDRVRVAMYFLMALRKETDGIWRVAREFLIYDGDTD
jgi:ketosteroid isomerase-like protein